MNWGLDASEKSPARSALARQHRFDHNSLRAIENGLEMASILILARREFTYFIADSAINRYAYVLLHSNENIETSQYFDAY